MKGERMMNRMLRSISLIVGSIALVISIGLVGCGGRSEESEWKEFSDKFFSETRGKDEKALLELSWLDRQFIKENAVDPEVDIGEAISEMQQDYMEDIAIYLNSYEDLFSCEPAVMTRYPHEFSQVPKLKELDPMIVVIWVKKDSKYHGIYIPCVVKTSDGRKVMDWLKLSGYEASRKHQLRKRRIHLVADSPESCELQEFNKWENVFEGSDPRHGIGSPAGGIFSR